MGICCLQILEIFVFEGHNLVMSNRSTRQMNKKAPQYPDANSRSRNVDMYTLYEKETSATETPQSQFIAAKEKNVSSVSLQSNDSGFETDSSRTDLKQHFMSNLYSVQEYSPDHSPNLEGQRKMSAEAVSPANQESSTSSLHQYHGRMHSLPHTCHITRRRWSSDSHHNMCKMYSSGSTRGFTFHFVSAYSTHMCWWN